MGKEWNRQHPERQKALLQAWNASENGKRLRQERSERKRAEHRTRMDLALAGGCVECGAQERLTFHHRDKNTKRDDVSRMHTATDETFWAEVAKCDVLCNPCHTRRHWDTDKRR